MATPVPPEMVEFHYEQSPPLYGCRSCEHKGKQTTIKEHVLAFMQETKARTHVTKAHSGHTFKQIIQKESILDLLNSGVHPDKGGRKGLPIELRGASW